VIGEVTMALLMQCAPMVSPGTMAEIVRVESAGKVLAINVNGAPRSYQIPKTLDEAVGIAEEAMENGRNVDVGLAQVNSRNLEKMEVSIRDAFDPCLNLELGGTILHANYLRAKRKGVSDAEALAMAISAYNTGSFAKGFENGYVGKVYATVVPDIHQVGRNTSAEVRATEDAVIVRMPRKTSAARKQNRVKTETVDGIRVMIDRSALQPTEGEALTGGGKTARERHWHRPWFR